MKKETKKKPTKKSTRTPARKLATSAKNEKILKSKPAKKPAAKKRGEKLKQLRHQKPWLVIVAILAAAFVIVLGAIEVWKPKQEPVSEPESALLDETEEPEPEPEPIGPLEIPENVSEEERELAANYHVASDRPRLISIPSVGVYARVQEVGLVNGVVDAPVDIRMTGWYNLSQLPGEKGAALIDGHGGNAGNGIFRPLEGVKEGAEIYIEMGDEETRYLYRVTEVLWYEKGAQADNYMATALSPVTAETPTLTLITCGGTWIPAEQTYTHRVFVRAVLEK